MNDPMLSPSTFATRFATTLAVAVLTLLLTPDWRDASARRDVDRRDLQLAEGILVQPGAGDLEPPAVADEDYDDNAPTGGPDGVAAPPPPGEGRQEQLEQPGARQEGVERGDRRQDDLELPDGPGQKY